jgi:hypothetical protein
MSGRLGGSSVAEGSRRWSSLAAASVIVSCALLSLGACQRGPVASPSPTFARGYVGVDDTLTRPGSEAERIVVAILVRGSVRDNAWAAFRLWTLPPSESCDVGAFDPGEVAKGLDPLHPDAVQPALPYSPILQTVFQVPKQDDFAGWLSWLIPLPPQACSYSAYVQAGFDTTFGTPPPRNESDVVAVFDVANPLP